MSLIFTDAETKKITFDILALPLVIADAQAQKASNEAKTPALQVDEDGRKKYFDNFQNIVLRYHAEILPKNGTQKTTYTESILQDGANRVPGNQHFPLPPDPIWKNFIPKLATQNNGNPSGSVPNHELSTIPLVEQAISTLKTGFTDGVLDDTAATAPAAGEVEVDVGGFVVGNKIVIDQLNISLLATITDVSGTPMTGAQLIAYTIITGTEAGLGIGARVRNFHPGFTNAEREGTSTPYAPAVMAYWKSLVDPQVTAWKGYVTPQETALLANDATGTEATEISAELANIQDALADINAFETAPLTGAGVGKYGDTILNPISTDLTERTSEIPTRATQITTALGSVTQNPADGSFVKTGNHGEVFFWVDRRINFATGSLTALKRNASDIAFYDQQVTGSQDLLASYQATFLVKKVTVNGTGNEFLTLENVSGLAVSNQVKVMDNDSAVLDRTIVDIQGNVVEFDTAIGVSLLVSKSARVAKRL